MAGASVTPEERREPPSLARLAAVFGWVGLTSIGGGRFAHFWHEVSRRRGWLPEEDVVEGIAISSIVPGPSFGNLGVYLGGRLRGGPGALLGTLALILPGAAIMLALTVLYFERGQVPGAQSVFLGVGAASVGLALGSSVSVARRAMHGPSSFVLAVLAFAGVALLHLNPLAVVLPLALVGAWMYRPRIPNPAPITEEDLAVAEAEAEASH